MTTIYLIRHAEAEGNLYRRIQGHWNGQVTPRGQKQIDALAERFRDVPIDAVWSSDLQRTKDTAGAILKYHDLQLETTPRLREANLGVWEGRPWGDVEYESPEQMYYFNHDPAKWSIPQCERFPEVQARMRSVLAEIAARYDGQTVAVVSHGVAIRSFLASALGVKSEQIDTLPHGDNTAVACLRYDGGALTVEYYNDASHLPEELSTFGRQTWWKNKGADAGNLRFEPLQFPRDSAFFDSCYADAWAAAHGSTAGYTARPYLRSAKEHARTPHAVVKLLSGDKVVGCVGRLLGIVEEVLVEYTFLVGMHEVGAVAGDDEAVRLPPGLFLLFDFPFLAFLVRTRPFLEKDFPVGLLQLLSQPFERHVGTKDAHRAPLLVVDGNEI